VEEELKPVEAELKLEFENGFGKELELGNEFENGFGKEVSFCGTFTLDCKVVLNSSINVWKLI
jgi:hypothetical protein